MPAQFTRADSLREYITGATSDGGSQTDPNASIGHYRSSTEAVSLGISISTPLSGVSILYAGGANPTGLGTLIAVDANNLTWTPFGASGPGSPTLFSGTSDIEIVESLASPGQYLRISGTTPFTPGSSGITLSYLANNFWGFDDVSSANATAGIEEYRATIARNEASGSITTLQRWLALLGTPQTSNTTFLPSSGGGTITTTGSFTDWPLNGWCQIQNSSLAIKEVVYYSNRTNNALTVPSGGRARLGTTAVVGTLTDIVNPVPGVAIAMAAEGIQSFGASIQNLANVNTAPTGVVWNLGLTAATGLQIGTLTTNQQIGIWVWRDIPALTKGTPQALIQTQTSFNAA
jgi:hypothetical protein